MLEETGVRIDEGSVRYLKSQPWPFPQSLHGRVSRDGGLRPGLVLDDELLEAKMVGSLRRPESLWGPGAVMSPDAAQEFETDPSLGALVPPRSSRVSSSAWLSEDDTLNLTRFLTLDTPVATSARLEVQDGGKEVEGRTQAPLPRGRSPTPQKRGRRL